MYCQYHQLRVPPGNFETNLAIKNAVLQIPHIGDTLYAILGYMGHMFGEQRLLQCLAILQEPLNKDKLQDRHYTEDFVYSVADLSPTDIMVGIEIYKLQRNRPDHFGKGSPYESETDFVEKSGIDKLRDICKLDEVEFDIAIHKLFAAALIKQVGLGLVGNITGLCIITPIFMKLVNFIQLRANDPLFNLRIRDPED
jgi:hypothetical protein